MPQLAGFPLPAVQSVLQLTSSSIAYAVWGCPESQEVCIYTHGWPGSRVGGAMLHEVGLRMGVRIIAVDRPGFGRSPWDPTHSLHTWPGRVQELADKLQLDRFSLLGISGGAPFAAACARYLPPGRLVGLGLVCPLGPPTRAHRAAMAPPNRLLLAAARHWPGAACSAWRCSRALLAADPHALTRWALCPRDRAAMRSSPTTASAIRAAVLEGLAQGPRGVVHEMGLVQRPWGFDLGAIGGVGPVLMWQGQDDPVAPAAAAGCYEAIPGCVARYYPGETHTTLVVGRLAAALEELAAAAHSAQPSAPAEAPEAVPEAAELYERLPSLVWGPPASSGLPPAWLHPQVMVPGRALPGPLLAQAQLPPMLLQATAAVQLAPVAGLKGGGPHTVGAGSAQPAVGAAVAASLG